jgi:hypothetical protein
MVKVFFVTLCHFRFCSFLGVWKGEDEYWYRQSRNQPCSEKLYTPHRVLSGAFLGLTVQACRRV